MEAAIFQKPGNIEIKKIEIPITGICGTDVHIYTGDLTHATTPRILGHEFSGVVESVGEDVTRLKKGDHVVIEPNRNKKKHFCRKSTTVGISIDGGFQQFCKLPASVCYKFSPEKIDPLTAAFFEPVACVLHGVELLEVELGEIVVVNGVGAIGNMFAQCLAFKGVDKLIVVDISDEKLELAKKLIDSSVEVVTVNVLEEKNLKKVVLEHSHGLGAHSFVDCSGIPNAIPLGMSVVRDCGKIQQFGVPPEEKMCSINPWEIFRREIKIMGSFTNPYSNTKALSMLKKLKVKPLISKRIALKDIEEEGFKQILARKDLMKVVVSF